MRRLIEYFDRAYIINLRERTDRRRETEHEFARMHLKAPSDHIRIFTAERFNDPGPFPSIGTRGSFNSHRAVMELAIRDNLQNIIVCEDDISFRCPSELTITKLIDWIKTNDWDVLYFGYDTPSSKGLSGPAVPWSRDTIGGHFYAVNGRFMPIMVRYMYECEGRTRDHKLGGPMSRDGAFNHIRYVKNNIRVYVAVPCLAYQRSSRTNIWELPFYDRVIGFKQAVAAGRRLKNILRRWTNS